MAALRDAAAPLTRTVRRGSGKCLRAPATNSHGLLITPLSWGRLIKVFRARRCEVATLSIRGHPRLCGNAPPWVSSMDPGRKFWCSVRTGRKAAASFVWNFMILKKTQNTHFLTITLLFLCEQLVPGDSRGARWWTDKKKHVYLRKKALCDVSGKSLRCECFGTRVSRFSTTGKSCRPCGLWLFTNVTWHYCTRGRKLKKERWFTGGNPLCGSSITLTSSSL